MRAGSVLVEALYAQLELGRRLAAENKRLKQVNQNITTQKASECQKKVGFVESVMSQVRR